MSCFENLKTLFPSKTSHSESIDADLHRKQICPSKPTYGFCRPSLQKAIRMKMKKDCFSPAAEYANRVAPWKTRICGRISHFRGIFCYVKSDVLS
ncbi:hypothetical protein AVEN_177046-1 [Araneus ventricosus]|uniref:Uncharacterized protein n=1 Tax=Araneus ventricosus TaxID=182803 RepID=A0A4Y2CRR8_ARAVE|nr:hypothetical protein AVEN_177046-1 [Araneus ventricosus]